MLYIKTIDNDSPKSRHKAGIELLKYALYEEYGIKDIPQILHGEHGKPYFAEFDAHFNISHSKDHIAVLLCDCPCGVDVERITEVKRGIVSRVFTKSEAEFTGDSANRFTMLWTLKESYIKAIGRGIGFGLQNIEFKFDGGKILSNLGGEFETLQIDDFIVSCCRLE